MDSENMVSGEVTSSISWEASEYLQHDKGATWTIMLAVVTISLGVLAYLFLDWFSVVIAALLGLAVGVYGHRKPRTLTFMIDEGGVMVGDKKYDYDRFRSFSIVDEGQLKSAMFEPLKRAMPPLSIYFEPADEGRIKEVLSSYLPYKQRNLDFADKLFRKLRF